MKIRIRKAKRAGEGGRKLYNQTVRPAMAELAEAVRDCVQRGGGEFDAPPAAHTAPLSGMNQYLRAAHGFQVSMVNRDGKRVVIVCPCVEAA